MPWVRPTVTTIYERIVNGIESRLTGGVALLRRAVLRILAKVMAGEFHLNYGYIEYISNQVMVDTAETSWLDRHAYIWGVVRKGGAYAQGTARFTGTNGTLIPAGTVVTTEAGVEYSTDADGTVSAGIADIAITAIEVGASGNYSGATALQVVEPPDGVDSSAAVQGALAGGVDPETDEALRGRILQRIQEPPLGGAKPDYVRWALEVDGVSKAWCYAPGDVPATQAGIVRVVIAGEGVDPTPTAPIFVDDGTGKDDGTGTAYLHINEERPVAAVLQVWALVNRPVYFTIQVSPFNSDITAAIEANLTELFNSVSVPGTPILNTQIRDAIMRSGINNFRIQLIQNYLGQQLDPFGDIPNSGFDYLTLGDAYISEMV